MTFTLEFPRRPEDAIASLARGRPGEAAVLAGGTDLLLDVDEGRVNPTRVISLAGLPWNSHFWVGDGLTIGSTLPLRELERDPELARRIPGLADAIRAVGGAALRRQATVGGNLVRASAASDLIPILLALDATVTVVGPGGERTVPVGEFVKGARETALGKAELISSVRITEARPSVYVWQRVRPANDISQVGVALALASEPPFWRIAVGGVTPIPRRLPSAEELLEHPVPTDVERDLASHEAAARASFVTDKRATEAYRRRVVAALTRRAIGATVRLSSHRRTGRETG